MDNQLEPKLDIRFPHDQEGFCLTGNAEYCRCLIFNGLGGTRLYHPVEGEALQEIGDRLHRVLFHHALSLSGEQFAIPEILGLNEGNCSPVVSCHDQIFKESPNCWMGIDYTWDHEPTLFVIGLSDAPTAISPQAFVARLNHALAPWVINSLEHPWIKKLTDSPALVQLSREVW